MWAAELGGGWVGWSPHPHPHPLAGWVWALTLNQLLQKTMGRTNVSISRLGPPRWNLFTRVPTTHLCYKPFSNTLRHHFKYYYSTKYLHLTPKSMATITHAMQPLCAPIKLHKIHSHFSLSHRFKPITYWLNLAICTDAYWQRFIRQSSKTLFFNFLYSILKNLLQPYSVYPTIFIFFNPFSTINILMATETTIKLLMYFHM